MPGVIWGHRGPGSPCPLDGCFTVCPPKEGSYRGKVVRWGFLLPPYECCCIKCCGFGVGHNTSFFPCSNLPFSILSPQASGLSAGPRFSCQFGWLERNIVWNRDLRKVLIFCCLSNLSKKCWHPTFPSASSAFLCSTAREEQLCLAGDKNSTRTPQPFIPGLSRPRGTARICGGLGGVFTPNSTALSNPRRGIPLIASAPAPA